MVLRVVSLPPTMSRMMLPIRFVGVHAARRVAVRHHRNQVIARRSLTRSFHSLVK